MFDMMCAHKQRYACNSTHMWMGEARLVESDLFSLYVCAGDETQHTQLAHSACALSLRTQLAHSARTFSLHTQPAHRCLYSMNHLAPLALGFEEASA